MKRLSESIFDEPDLKTTTAIVNSAWLDKYGSGRYTMKFSKHGMIIKGSIIIENFTGEDFPELNIISADKIVISNCPNVKNLGELFNENAVINEMLEISDCGSIENLDGLPPTIKRLYVVDCSNLRGIEGLTNLKTAAQVSLIRIGRKYKKEYIKRIAPLANIKCSLGADDVLTEGFVYESTNAPEVRDLMDQLRSEKKNGAGEILRQLIERYGESIPIDAIRPRDIDIFELTTGDTPEDEKKRKAVAKEIRAFFQDTEPGIIYLQDPNDEIIKIASSFNRYYNRHGNIWIKARTRWNLISMGKTERIESLITYRDPEKPIRLWGSSSSEYVPKIYKVVIIHVPAEAVASRRDTQRNRDNIRQGMVENTPEYYASVARANIARYKKMLVLARAARKKDKFTDIVTKCSELYSRAGKLGEIITKSNPDMYAISVVTTHLKNITDNIKMMMVYANQAEKDGTPWAESEAESYYVGVQKSAERLEEALKKLRL